MKELLFLVGGGIVAYLCYPNYMLLAIFIMSVAAVAFAILEDK